MHEWILSLSFISFISFPSFPSFSIEFTVNPQFFFLMHYWNLHFVLFQSILSLFTLFTLGCIHFLVVMVLLISNLDCLIHPLFQSNAALPPSLFFHFIPLISTLFFDISFLKMVEQRFVLNIEDRVSINVGRTVKFTRCMRKGLVSVTLVWNDPPAQTHTRHALQNDLDLTVSYSRNSLVFTCIFYLGGHLFILINIKKNEFSMRIHL